jgi:hypothetical protein
MQVRETERSSHQDSGDSCALSRSPEEPLIGSASQWILDYEGGDLQRSCISMLHCNLFQKSIPSESHVAPFVSPKCSLDSCNVS